MSGTIPAGIPQASGRIAEEPPHSADLYLDRELSLLAFQGRVLEEARCPANPLLERIKFLSIFFSNLDEFYMVRVAVLNQNAACEPTRGTAVQLERIDTDVRRLVADAYALWPELQSGLGCAGIAIRDYGALSLSEQEEVNAYFRKCVYPTLTPLAVDMGHPFPHVSNLSLSLAITLLDEKGAKCFARVKVPDALPQLVAVQPPSGSAPGTGPSFIWLEQLIQGNLDYLFPGLSIVEAHPFRITRDAEYEIQELESDDLLETIEEAVWKRRFRSVVRLQVASHIPGDLLEVLMRNLEVGPRDVHRIEGPLDLGRLRQLMSLDRPELKDAPFVPHTPPALQMRPGDDLFATLRREDVLLHHPFESFQPVVEFLQQASVDPAVIAIKITLYRVGRNSPIVDSLLRAIENGKQVAVLVELKARFDEQSNIEWARALEAAGVHVVYGLVGLKVHSKVALVVRREADGIRRYVHLGTGNYNPSTARLYTDLSFFTTNEQIGADVTDLFNLVTSFPGRRTFQKLLVAPAHLRTSIERLIRREIQHASNGNSARLVFKMNSLEDHAMIRLLYEASQAGVKVDLLVRGICCLRPGVPGLSENIQVTSIVGRFLEHSRIYYFYNVGAEEVYLGSADLMGRNLDRRIEVLFPVETPRLIARLRDDILARYLVDDRNARRMAQDGSYAWDQGQSNSHAQFLRQASLLPADNAAS